jgi:hypothetical protein
MKVGLDTETSTTAFSIKLVWENVKKCFKMGSDENSKKSRGKNGQGRGVAGRSSSRGNNHYEQAQTTAA